MSTTATCSSLLDSSREGLATDGGAGISGIDRRNPDGNHPQKSDGGRPEDIARTTMWPLRSSTAIFSANPSTLIVRKTVALRISSTLRVVCGPSVITPVLAMIRRWRLRSTATRREGTDAFVVLTATSLIRRPVVASMKATRESKSPVTITRFIAASTAKSVGIIGSDMVRSAFPVCASSMTTYLDAGVKYRDTPACAEDESATDRFVDRDRTVE